MAELSQQKILNCLKEVWILDLKNDVVSAGFVGAIQINGPAIKVRLQIPVTLRKLQAHLQSQCREKLSLLTTIENVQVEVGFQIESKPGSQTSNAPADLPVGDMGESLPGVHQVRHVLAIASGKGGVGKSTVTANLASSLVKQGFRVGLMDTDIYGPSMGMMFNITEPPHVDQNKKLYPVFTHGLKVISMSMFSDDETAVIWRGPMVSQMVQTFLRNVVWGELDFLLIDLPPGTGDIQLTLTQSAPLSGAVIVTTPQEVSLLDAKKGLKMFEKVSVPVLGIVENMSYFICDGCDKKHSIFQQGGGSRTARAMGVPFLGEIPLDPRISACGDAGEPMVMKYPESEVAKQYLHFAMIVAKRLESLKNQGEMLTEYNYKWEELESV